MTSQYVVQAMASAYRHAMLVETQQRGRPDIVKAWQMEWQDTPDAYREVWLKVAQVAAEALKQDAEQAAAKAEEIVGLAETVEAALDAAPEDTQEIEAPVFEDGMSRDTTMDQVEEGRGSERQD